jgi:hypothetical protein
MGDMKKAYKMLGGKTEGKRSLGKPRDRWRILDWILEGEGVDWIHLAHDRTSGWLL